MFYVPMVVMYLKTIWLKKDSSYFLHQQCATQINMESMIEAYVISPFW